MDSRKQLYERLTFTFHRAETALDFLSIRGPAIVPDIKSLQLSIQVSAPRRSEGWGDIPPELPWHCTPDTWMSLRDSLAEMNNLCHLSVWLDACSQMAREYLLFDYFYLFVFDPRPEPILRVSIPISDRLSDYYPSRHTMPYVVERGTSELWQEPSIAPHITFSERYGTRSLYQVARHGGPVGPFPLRRTLRRYFSDNLDVSKWKSRVLPQ